VTNTGANDTTQTTLTFPTSLELQLATEDKSIVCDFCNKGQIIHSFKELKLKQLADVGYVHFRAMLKVGVCDHCGGRSTEPGDDRILDEAFQREYAKLKADIEIQQSTRLSANPGILLSSEFRAIAGDLIAQLSARTWKLAA
jgi:hypothetical protein